MRLSFKSLNSSFNNKILQKIPSKITKYKCESRIVKRNKEILLFFQCLMWIMIDLLN